jgi:ADP-heptose:LPS heptosyltransferase
MLNEFKKIRDAGALTAETAASLAMRAADLAITRRAHENNLRDAVTILCEITADQDPAIARAGVAALFPALIEKLNDSFDPEFRSLYDRVFAQVIDFYRRLPAGAKLDQGLRRFGLMDEKDLLARKTQISNLKPGMQDPESEIQKILLLSRVTIGADVAVTSVIMARLREAFPDAEFVWLGSRKLRELFGGDPGWRLREIAYERGGGVLSRLTSWLDVVAISDDEYRGYRPDEILLIDPDSRLTQLGLLPLIEDEKNYCFFESRSYRSPGATRLGELASSWVNERFEMKGRTYPYVALPEGHRTFGRAVAEKLRRGGASRLVTISLGVGGNAQKRLSDSFETKLIDQLLEDSTLIIDKGASREERDQIDRITSILRSQGKTMVELDERSAADKLGQESIRAHAVTWEGGIGAFAALIAASDEYLGYDSAGQHIAAALGVPTLTIFVNANPLAFAERWSPDGPGVIKVLRLNAADSLPEDDALLSQTLMLRRQ